MKKLLILLTIFAGVSVLASRAAVNYGEVEVEVTMHPDQYRALLDRFISADTTLTNAEVTTIYYGYPFTPGYEPRDSFPEIHKAYQEADFHEVARLVESALELNPLSLDLMIMGLGAYERGAGDSPGKHSLNLAIRCDQLATAILESGRGTFAQSPFYVISSSDRDRILHNVLGVGEILDTTTVGPIEAIKFTFPNTTREHILYFDNTIEKKFLQAHP